MLHLVVHAPKCYLELHNSSVQTGEGLGFISSVFVLCGPSAKTEPILVCLYSEMVFKFSNLWLKENISD